MNKRAAIILAMVLLCFGAAAAAVGIPFSELQGPKRENVRLRSWEVAFAPMVSDITGRSHTNAANYYQPQVHALDAGELTPFEPARGRAGQGRPSTPRGSTHLTDPLFRSLLEPHRSTVVTCWE